MGFQNTRGPLWEENWGVLPAGNNGEKMCILGVRPAEQFPQVQT